MRGDKTDYVACYGASPSSAQINQIKERILSDAISDDEAFAIINYLHDCRLYSEMEEIIYLIMRQRIHLTASVSKNDLTEGLLYNMASAVIANVTEQPTMSFSCGISNKMLFNPFQDETIVRCC